jgi:hypothetical protein
MHFARGIGALCGSVFTTYLSLRIVFTGAIFLPSPHWPRLNFIARVGRVDYNDFDLIFPAGAAIAIA